MNTYLTATGINIWPIIALGVLLLISRMPIWFYCFLRKSSEFTTSKITIGGAALLYAPTYVADGVDCNAGQRQAPVAGGSPSSPSGPPATPARL